MNLLLIGTGGREHAIAYLCAKSPLVEKVFVATGNAGTHREPNVENIDVDVSDFATLAQFAKNNQVGLTVVGPEAPLVEGIVDYFQERELPIFGPNKLAAQLEGSKAFSKAFLHRHHIPTAKSETFEDIEQAKTYIEAQGAPIVVKADGLAAGKGVVVATTTAQALEAIDAMLGRQKFGASGARVVVEEFLQGQELSFIVMTDGQTIVPLASSQDHKARDDGDTGPNTGGMGAYSPVPFFTDRDEQYILANIIQPTLEGLKKDGITYQGFLYAGLMKTDKGYQVLEFNCRLGDPETQPLLMRLDSDLVEAMLKTTQVQLHDYQIAWKAQFALAVVMAAQGYPNQVVKGDAIEGLNDLPTQQDVKVFHAGTALNDGKIITNGGRVLAVTCLGDTLEEAQQKAYKFANKINWPGCFYRNDIGNKALTPLLDCHA